MVGQGHRRVAGEGHRQWLVKDIGGWMEIIGVMDDAEYLGVEWQVLVFNVSSLIIHYLFK